MEVSMLKDSRCIGKIKYEVPLYNMGPKHLYTFLATFHRNLCE